MTEQKSHVFCQKYTTRRDEPFIIYFGKGSSFPYHWHEEMEIVYIIDGTMSFYIGTTEYRLVKGNIINISAAQVHRYESREGCTFLTLEFGHYLDMELFGMLESISERIPVVINEDNVNWNGSVQRIMLRILEENRNRNDGWNIMIRGLVLELGALYIRFFSGQKPDNSSKKTTLRGYNDILHEVFEYIENNYDSDIGIDEVSEIANFSKSYFNKFFKRMTNMSFNKYINDIRLEKAGIMLKVSADNVAQIAFSTGFNSVKTFTRLFKEKYGMTPGMYRKTEIKNIDNGG